MEENDCDSVQSAFFMLFNLLKITQALHHFFNGKNACKEREKMNFQRWLLLVAGFSPPRSVPVKCGHLQLLYRATMCIT